jgi:DNA-binding winged helix-turn-helix (wHTH) protein
VRYRFSDCVLDTGARELRRDGAAVPLSPLGLQLLGLLLEARPRALRQSELRDALWPSTHVGYTSLARVVNEVRRAIGDTSTTDRVVRTVPRFGYAFAGPAVMEATDASRPEACALVAKQAEYPLAEGESLVGRGSECAVRLQSDQVSRVHARVRVEGRVATIEDRGSKNGTWVNGVRAAGPVTLADGDEVVFGTFRVVFRTARTADRTRTGSPLMD